MIIRDQDREQSIPFTFDDYLISMPQLHEQKLVGYNVYKAILLVTYDNEKEATEETINIQTALITGKDIYFMTEAED